MSFILWVPAGSLCGDCLCSNGDICLVSQVGGKKGYSIQCWNCLKISCGLEIFQKSTLLSIKNKISWKIWQHPKWLQLSTVITIYCEFANCGRKTILVIRKEWFDSPEAAWHEEKKTETLDKYGSQEIPWNSMNSTIMEQQTGPHQRPPPFSQWLEEMPSHWNKKTRNWQGEDIILRQAEVAEAYMWRVCFIRGINMQSPWILSLA